jgi:hypothetical protein
LELQNPRLVGDAVLDAEEIRNVTVQTGVKCVAIDLTGRSILFFKQTIFNFWAKK